ncbi:MAG: hypothetical protein R3C45_10120 [Phycisphaerales bacterium]
MPTQHVVDPLYDLSGLGVSLCVLIDPDGPEAQQKLARRWSALSG